MRPKNILRHGEEILLMMLIIESMELQNQKRKDIMAGTVTGPIISMMKTLRKIGGDILSRIRII